MKFIPSHINPANLANRQRGASLLEGIAYLGIAAVVIIGAVALMRGAFTNAQSNSLVQEIVSIRANVRKLFAGQGGYANAHNGNLIAARAFPDSVATDATTGTVTNAWGSNIWVSAVNNNTQFTITYAGIPRDVCINALSGTTGWVSITIGVQTINAFPVTPTVAVNTCVGTVNAIVWTAA